MRRLLAGCAQVARRLRVKKTRHRLARQLRQPPTIEAIERVPYFADVELLAAS